MCFFDAVEQQESGHGCPQVDDDDSETLSTEETPSVTVQRTTICCEKSREDCAENTADTMDGACAYWIIDVKTVVNEFNRINQYDSAYQTDDDGAQRRYEVATCCYAHQSGQHAVQSQRQ